MKLSVIGFCVRANLVIALDDQPVRQDLSTRLKCCQRPFGGLACYVKSRLLLLGGWVGCAVCGQYTFGSSGQTPGLKLEGNSLAD